MDLAGVVVVPWDGEDGVLQRSEGGTGWVLVLLRHRHYERPDDDGRVIHVENLWLPSNRQVQVKLMLNLANIDS